MNKTALWFVVASMAFVTMTGGALGQTSSLLKRSAMGITQEEMQAQKQAGDARRAATAPAAPILEAAIDPAEYVLGPGDELVVSVMGPDSRSFIVTVLPEGDVFLPEIGAVRGDGLTLESFRAALTEKLNRHFRNVDFYCYLRTPARFRVFVTGEVERPGAVEVSGVERIADAIEKAGGATAIGSSRLVSVERMGERIPVDLERFLKKGEIKDNPYLRSGDRVHIPPKGAFSVIYGEVKKPGWYEILAGETIRDLIDLAGGFTTDALVDSVVRARVQESGAVLSTTLTAAGFEEELQDKDEIGVFSRFKYRKFVYVEGAIQRTGRFYLAENEGLTELIVRAGGFTPDADLSAAYIGRKDGTVVTVNLRDYLPPNAKANLALNDGDVLAIPRIPNTVTVGGEVNAPGEFKYMGDLTIVQYIGLAGGPTKEGSVDRVVVYASDGTARNVSRDDLPGRGDVIVVKRSYSRILADVFRGVLSAGTLVVSILILTTTN